MLDFTKAKLQVIEIRLVRYEYQVPNSKFFFHLGEDGDGSTSGPKRYEPKSIEYFLKVTRFTKKELKTLYRNFKNVSFKISYQYLVIFCVIQRKLLR